MEDRTIGIRDNAFDFLRLIGAYIVLLSHSFRHLGVIKPIWSLFFTEGSIGVIIFFTITGFVIMPAWERAQKKKHPFISFLWNRIIRIYPGLLFMFLIISLLNYFIYNVDIFSISYLKYSILFFAFPRGGAYAGGIGNGVLWTIVPDMVFYFLTPIIYKIMHNKKTSTWIIVILVFWQFNVFDASLIEYARRIPFFGGFVDSGFSWCFLYEFLIGSFFYFKKDTILVSLKNNRIFVAIYFLIATTFFTIYTYWDFIPKTGEMHTPWIGILFSPLVIIVGFALGKKHIKVDLSFGIFLLHMLVVGILLHYGIEGVNGILIVALTTPVLAFIFHYIVEVPAERLKI